MRLSKHMPLIFGLLLIAGQAANAFNVCRSQGVCRPDSECCGADCMPLIRKDCNDCSLPPCRCRNGECLSSGGGRTMEIKERVASDHKVVISEVQVKKEPILWPDILLIVCFAVVIAFCLSSGILWAYLTFRDTRKLQRDEAERKVQQRKAVSVTRSQSSLKRTPVRKVSSKSSKEVDKAQSGQ